MKLYFSPGACSLASHITLYEAGLPCTVDKVDMRTRKTSDGQDFTAINPKGYVPALKLDSGEVLSEVGVICQYLADQKPAANLAPAAGTMARYHLMEWLNFVATEVHKSIGALFNPKMTPEMKEVQLGVIERRLNALEKMIAGKTYLMGDAFSVADAYLFTVINWSRIHKIDMAKWPNIQAFMARVAARPKVRAAMQAEGLLK